MKFLYTLVLGFACLTVNAQNLIVLDAATKQPVPFTLVTAILRGEPVSRDYCNQDGTLTVSVKNYEMLQFSCLGYKEVVIKKSDVGAQVLLQPDAFELDEVVISGKTDVLTVGYIDNKKLNFSGTAAGFQDAVYIPNTLGSATTIKSFLFKIVKSKNRFAYRLHFYKPSLIAHTPGEEITHDNIIGFIEKDAKGLTELDLSVYAVEFPLEGVYVSIEGLGTCDANGTITETKKDAFITYETFRTAEPIFCHQPEFFIKNGWINENERIIRDFEYMKEPVPKDALRAPSFGLKVYR
ncbi:carboxypeptidase-like regulatory domain-containing protein [Flavobacterium zepuense]|uniref:Carboxypeptidase-like regulatory domain-containing protein n=1 Tax=Flavobacterium zepuense TaxID=2593302 RepID=A0A552UTH8_9FLAO|nr:carboxypeptidase-like regulatory domain-containing protein [Flavobacterium zepuense]TRW21514.1 carboxypeptidase-like regulatory domain-containing protein [Flavobacterium zepuense]